MTHLTNTSAINPHKDPRITNAQQATVPTDAAKKAMETPINETPAEIKAPHAEVYPALKYAGKIAFKGCMLLAAAPLVAPLLVSGCAVALALYPIRLLDRLLGHLEKQLPAISPVFKLLSIPSKLIVGIVGGAYVAATLIAAIPLSFIEDDKLSLLTNAYMINPYIFNTFDEVIMERVVGKPFEIRQKQDFFLNDN